MALAVEPLPLEDGDVTDSDVTSAVSATECLICREIDGRVELPGGHLIADDAVVAFHCPPTAESPRPYIGYLFVVSRRHIPGFADLTDHEAASVGIGIARLSRVLIEQGAERVYQAVIGQGWPHLHVHLLPRYPDTPKDLSWMAVDEWEGAVRGDAAEVAHFVSRLRARLITGR